VTGIVVFMAEIRTGRALASATLDLQAIGRRLTAAREARKLSVTEAAERAGLNHNTLSQWETGARRPSLEQLALMLPVLRVTLDFVYLGDDRSLDWETREAIAAQLAALPHDDSLGTRRRRVRRAPSVSS